MFFKGEIPFVRLLVPLIAGITIGWYVPAALFIKTGLLIAIVLLCILIALLIAFKTKVVYSRRWMPGIILHTFVVFAGYFSTVYKSEIYDTAYFSNSKADAFVIRVINEPKLSGDILRFESEVTQTLLNNTFKAVKGKLLIALKTDTLKPFQLDYGDVLIVPSLYNEVEPPYNPGEFDFKNYLKTHQIYYQAFINQHDFQILQKNKGNPVISYALRLRKKLVEKYETYLPDEGSAALASTLILGYRADLSKEIVNAYSKTGTMHVLSVSGMHVGIVFLVLNFLLRPLSRTQKTRLLRAVVIIAVIWFYSLITGFSPSVCRAALMLTFIVIGKALHKNLNTYNLLAISAFILLLYNPFFLLDVGFQLSYLAVIGLVYLHPKIYNSITINNRLLDEAWSYCALSVAAQLATFPISIYYFHQFPVYFLISNLFIVLPVALIMYGGILFLFIPFDVILKPLGQAVSWLIDFTNNILYHVENLPYSNISGLWINTSQYLLIYLIIGCMIWGFRAKSGAVIQFSLFCILVLTASFSYQVVSNFNRNELVFYSLRKNSAVAYINNDRGVLISDLPAADKTLQFSVEPALNSKGYADYRLFKPSQNKVYGNYCLQGSYMQFGSYKVLRWEKQFNAARFDHQIKVNAVLLSGNPAISIGQLEKQVKFSILLIDGTNPDYKIKRWLHEAELEKIQCHVLKKNAAYVVKL